MSFEHIKTMLETASDTRKWLTTSKIVRGIKWWKNNAAHVALLGMCGTASLVFWKLSSIRLDTPVDNLGLILSASVMPLMLVPFLALTSHVVRDYFFSKIWNKKTFFTGQRNSEWVVSYKTTNIKSAVMENFMNLHGEQWDTLAPVLHKCVQEDGLPYLWWSDLNAHLVDNLRVQESESAPLQTVSVESLDEQLTRHAQTLKSTNHSLSI